MASLSSPGIQIMEQQLQLARHITDLHFRQHPELEIKYGKEGREKCIQDSMYHLSYLAEAVRGESQEIFSMYIAWAQSMLESRKIPAQDLIDNLKCMDSSCEQLLADESYQIVTRYITNAIERVRSGKTLAVTYITEGNPLYPYTKRYLALLLEGNRNQAQSLILDLVKDGQPVSAIYEYVFQVSQYEVGLLWQINKITVAHEHYCTAATQLIMASLYPYIFDSKKKGARMLACTVSGDLHEIGIRMVADLFEMDGWDTYYMGANMPHASIISAAKEQHADVLAISVTMPFHVTNAENLIKRIRNESALNNLKIIVGGYPFTLVPDLWIRIGADGTANSAKDAIKMANKLITLDSN